MASNRMHIAVIGTGALGCLFGARLVDNANVILLGSWSRGLTAINQRGICVDYGDKTQHVQVSAYSDPQQVTPVDIALILVKSWQTERAAALAKSVLGPKGLVVTLQNGLGNFEKLCGIVGSSRAIAGVTTQGAVLKGPGHVCHYGGGATYLGVRSHTRERLERLGVLFEDSGFVTVLTDKLDEMIWSKLIVNTGLNAVSALLGVQNGVLLTRPDGEELMVAAAQETAAVAAASGINIPFDPAEQVKKVAALTSGNISSMLQDIRRGAPTEIEYINCAVARIGEQLGVSVPVNLVLCKLLNALCSHDTNNENRLQFE